MGIFDLFKSNKKEPKKEFEFTVDLKKHLVDNLYIISLPDDWKQYESDRFRAKTDDDKLQISITNYAHQSKGDFNIDSLFFKELKLHLYEDYVTGGGYEPYDDLKVTDNFITKSFKVDDETQYYYTTGRNVNEQLIITEIIVREIGGYDKKMQPLLEIIGNSIQVVKN